MSQPELQLVSQMLAEEVTERAEEQQEHAVELAAAIARADACEAAERECRVKLATFEAECAAAKSALEAERQARAESERRCTYLISEMRKEEAKEQKAPAYKLVVTGRDGNDAIRTVSIVPEA